MTNDLVRLLWEEAADWDEPKHSDEVDVRGMLYSSADRIEALTAENERLREALREMFEVVCGETGFAQAVRADSGFAYPWPALDLAEAKARAALGDTQ